MRLALVIAALWSLAAQAGPADYPGAMKAFDTCLAGVTYLEETASCIGSFTEACSEVRIARHEDLADGLCMSAETALWDDRLNASWAGLKQRLQHRPETMAAMTAAQRAWIGFRDAECAALAVLWADSSTAEAERAACLRNLTAERHLTLQQSVEGNQ